MGHGKCPSPLACLVARAFAEYLLPACRGCRAGSSHQARQCPSEGSGCGFWACPVSSSLASPCSGPCPCSPASWVEGGPTGQDPPPAPQRRPWSQTAWVGLGSVCPAPSPGKWGCYAYRNWCLQGTRTGLGTCDTHSSSLFTPQTFECL